MYNHSFHLARKTTKKKKEKKKWRGGGWGGDNTDLMICPGIMLFVSLPTTPRGQCKVCFYLLQIIPCSVLTDNDECIRIYYGEERTLVLLHCYPFSRI